MTTNEPTNGVTDWDNFEEPTNEASNQHIWDWANQDWARHHGLWSADEQLRAWSSQVMTHGRDERWNLAYWLLDSLARVNDTEDGELFRFFSEVRDALEPKIVERFAADYRELYLKEGK